MRRLTDESKPKDLPSNEQIAATIRRLRMYAELYQSDIATKVHRTRSWMLQVERNKINPVYFYEYFVKLYGRKLAIETYGIDWDLYRSDRVALYYAYYNVNRKISCDTIGCSFTTLNYLLAAPGKYIESYQLGIDKVFPRIKEDQKLLSHFHLVGNNSMVEIDGDKAYVTMNCASKRKLDTLENRDVMKKDIDYWISYHKEHDGDPETGIFVIESQALK